MALKLSKLIFMFLSVLVIRANVFLKLQYEQREKYVRLKLILVFRQYMCNYLHF